MNPEDIPGMTPELAARFRAEKAAAEQRMREHARQIIRQALWALHPDPEVRKAHGHGA